MMKCPQCHARLSLGERSHIFGWEGSVCPHCSARLRSEFWWAPAAFLLLGFVGIQVNGTYGFVLFALTAVSVVATFAYATITATRE